MGMSIVVSKFLIFFRIFCRPRVIDDTFSKRLAVQSTNTFLLQTPSNSLRQRQNPTIRQRLDGIRQHPFQLCRLRGYPHPGRRQHKWSETSSSISYRFTLNSPHTPLSCLAKILTSSRRRILVCNRNRLSHRRPICPNHEFRLAQRSN